MSAATVKTKTETKTKTKTKPLNQPGTLYTEQDCADAVTMYNESEGDPEAGDYLLEASECFENLGHYGKSIKVLTVLHEREANTARKKDGRKRLVAVFETLLDPDRGDVGPAGAACLAPLEETDAAALAVERLAAADCLHASLLVASAIRQRELAGPHLAEAERALNATTLQELKELAATLRTLRTDALGPHDATTESPGP